MFTIKLSKKSPSSLKYKRNPKEWKRGKQKPNANQYQYL